ncbi:hypothetical protein TEA_011052 [Camellia sinensis var. sinensis]|uniref:Endonuclease/exonuclease/phosphatase domain-containing protein n=1 Tax=Camellia sinensis var. sinensis TaxID=542762 RepID=A0A4S4DTX4_CAMSN|nr:hypothetical protein TEA_011052 [Camellia sinensis var. sinensis]
MGESMQDFCDEEQQAPSSNSVGCVSCTTFNILAPIYKRLNGQNCESEFRELWLSRNESILDRLLTLSSSIICLQEFWVHNEELVTMYEKRLGDAGYVTYKLARTNNRGDGLLTAVHQNHFHVLNYQECLFNDIGDRVAQLLHVEDWNGSKKGNVYKFLQSQGFVSSYDIAHPYTNDAEDLSKWISHHNHRGNVCGVDFIFLHNPSNYQRPVKESFMEAVLGNINDLSHKLSTKGVGPLHFFETDSSHITYSQFSHALAEVFPSSYLKNLPNF